jgi:hypothetical protein
MNATQAAADLLSSADPYAKPMVSAKTNWAQAQTAWDQEVAKLAAAMDAYADARNNDIDVALKARSGQLDQREAALAQVQTDLAAREAQLAADREKYTAAVAALNTRTDFADAVVKIGASAGLHSAVEVQALKDKITFLSQTLAQIVADASKAA